MAWFNGLIAYILIWFALLFMVLPFGVRTAAETGDALEPGQATSAPIRPRIGMKLLATTGLAVVGWGIYYWIYQTDLFGLGAWLYTDPLQGR